MRNVATVDESFSMRSRRPRINTRDLRLEALTPGKQQVSWMTWQGDLAPVVHDMISSLGTINDGPKLGEPFSAEQGPVSPIMLGRVFDGTLEQIRGAVMQARTDGAKDDTVDVGELYQVAMDLQEKLEAGDPQGAQTAFDSLRKTRDAINARRPSKVKPTGDTVGQRETARVTSALAQFQAGAAKLWGRKPVATADSRYTPGVVRDHLHAAHHATNMADKITALNEANRAHWQRHTADVGALSAGQVAPANVAIERINQANATFWAARR